MYQKVEERPTRKRRRKKDHSKLMAVSKSSYPTLLTTDGQRWKQGCCVRTLIRPQCPHRFFNWRHGERATLRCKFSCPSWRKYYFIALGGDSKEIYQVFFRTEIVSWENDNVFIFFFLSRCRKLREGHWLQKRMLGMGVYSVVYIVLGSNWICDCRLRFVLVASCDEKRGKGL